jgi:hypothetical protein
MADAWGTKRHVRPATVICSDAHVLNVTLSGLLQWGVAARGLQHWRDLGNTRQPDEVIVVFTDYFDDASVLSHLRSLEERSSRTAVIAVTERAPALWVPRTPRELPAIVIHPRGLPQKLFEAIDVCSAAMNEIEIDDLEPELPFTD